MSQILTHPDQFYLSKSEPTSSCLLALRSIILAQDPNITETRKWSMPCFCYHGRMFCYLWTEKKTGEPYILFVEGTFLSHPDLEAGSRSRMKVLHVAANADLPLNTIQSLLHQALELYRNGTIEIK